MRYKVLRDKRGRFSGNRGLTPWGRSHLRNKAQKQYRDKLGRFQVDCAPNLKPCPLCAKEVEMNPMMWGETGYVIECGSCHLSYRMDAFYYAYAVPKVRPSKVSKFAVKQYMVDKWNRRPILI